VRESLGVKPKGGMKVKAGSTGLYGIRSVTAERRTIAPSRLLAVGRRQSVHVGTRKMVNYA
jgi:hypothetical protein